MPVKLWVVEYKAQNGGWYLAAQIDGSDAIFLSCGDANEFADQQQPKTRVRVFVEEP